LSICKWSLYIHQNNINGKYYVGITSQTPETRWLNGHGYSNALPFGRAIRRYGWNNFEHKVLMHGLSEGHAKAMEKYMIGMLQTQDERYGYNLTSGGDGVSGFHHTDESKIRMSVAKQGAKHPNYGKHLTSATREKIASRLRGNKNCLGVVRSFETRHRMSVSKSKPVEMRSDGVLLRVFSSAKQAEAETGISRKNISLCCLNQRKHAGSYEWNFA
jgi:group I intron endonuclease